MANDDDGAASRKAEDDVRKAEMEEIDALLTKHKRVSRYASADAPTGSAAYWRKWKEANAERSKLYQKKALLRRKLTALAVEQAAGTAEPNKKPDTAKALQELSLELEAVTEKRMRLIDDGIIAPRGANPLLVDKAVEVKVPTVDVLAWNKAGLLGINWEKDVEALAARWHAGEVIDTTTPTAEEPVDAFAEEMNKRLSDIIGTPIQLDDGEPTVD